MKAQNQQLWAVTTDVLAGLANCEGAIERVVGISDVELGFQALLGSRPHSHCGSNPHRCIAVLRKWVLCPVQPYGQSLPWFLRYIKASYLLRRRFAFAVARRCQGVRKASADAACGRNRSSQISKAASAFSLSMR